MEILRWCVRPATRFFASIPACNYFTRLSLSVALPVLLGCAAATAQGKTATTTTLSATTSSGTAGTVASGTVVTLTASVTPASGSIKAGQVNFCDAAAPQCTDIHLLGTAQLTSAGEATLQLRPSIGSHGYKAVFPATTTNAASASTTVTVNVTGTFGPFASTTTFGETGSWGAYTLTATVTEAGGTAPATGNVSFVDKSNANSVLNTVALGASVAGMSWPNPQVLATNTGSQAVALGDFNGDGIPDVAAVAGGTSQPLVIMLGNADGTFTTAPSPSISVYTFGPMVVADFNGDGKQDLALLNGDNNTVTVLLGNGDGTFVATASSSSIAANSRQLALADFNGDGIADLAVISNSSNLVTVLLGNGDGTFTAGSTPAVGSSPNAIAVGDFNGDGKVDMAVGDLYDDGISILLGNGDGTFAASTTLHCGSNGSPIAVADFNGDGKLDLAVGVSGATPGADSVTILAGNGDGTFTVPSSGTAVSSSTITALQVGDFNADGIPDLALLDSNTGTAIVFAGDGAGSFTATSLAPAIAPYYNLVLALGDIDGDGRSDLVIGNYFSSSVAVYRTEPTETATASTQIVLANPGLHQADASYAGDINYHPSVSGVISMWGVPPVTTTALILTSAGNQVTSVAPGTVVTLTATVKAGASAVTAGEVNFCDATASLCTDIHLLGTTHLTNSGTAVFKFVPGPGQHSYKAVFAESGAGMSSTSNVASLTVGPAKGPVYLDTTSIAVGGLPGNYSLTATVEGFGGPAIPTGKVSFIDTSFGNAVLATANLGAGTAGTGWLISQTPALANNPVSEVGGDFNGDGIPDVALLWSTSASSGPGGVTILFGKGDGTFSTGPTAQLALAGQLDPYMIAGDFNGDGKTDLAILSWQIGLNVSTVTSLLGNGDGTFAAPQTSTAFNQGVVGGDGVPGSVVAADFNGDGKLDLAVVGDYIAPGGLTVLLGNGDGTFAPAGANLLPNHGFGLVAAGDFNGDGIPDLVTTNYFDPGGATVLLGKGDGTFTTAGQLTIDRFPRSIVIGDFNGDGALDLAMGYDSAVMVFLGKGDGTFNPAPGSPISGAGLSLVAGDFNHDGKMDLAGIDNYFDQIDLFVGAGDGTFTEMVTTPNISTDWLGPFAIVAADFNEDGVPDLSMLTNNVASASILLTQPTETVSTTVTGIVPIGAGTHNVEASYPGDSNYKAGVSATVPLTAGLAPLVISPPAGTYTSVQTITLSESVPGATIYYSAAGPLSTTGFVPYTGPITLSSAGVEVIQAYATETGYQQSDSLTALYTLMLPATAAPVISLASGYYAAAQTVTITDSQAGAKIYYTTNGTFPTVNSNLYSAPITVSSSETLVAAAVAYGYAFSPAVSAQYFIGSSANSLIYTIAGSGTYGYTGDGGPATLAELSSPTGIVKDSAGNVYFSDEGNHMVRKIAAGTGTITRFAGTGTIGYSGDGGPATSAELSFPATLLLDSGNLFIADSGNGTVRKLNLTTGIITTYAGNPAATTSGDGGQATAASLSSLGGIATDASHNLYIAQTFPSVIREVNDGTGIISTIAGTGQYSYSGDGGPAISATFGGPSGIAFDGSGNLYIADSGNQLIRKITATGGIITGHSIVSSVVGTPPSVNQYALGGYSGDGGPATSARLNQPVAVAFDHSGNLFISDSGNSAVRMVTAGGGIISTVVGDGVSCGSYGGDGGTSISASLCFPRDIAVDTAGDILIADQGANRVREAFAAGAPPSTQAAAPTFSVSSGTYSTPQTVTISDTTPGASIYVTVDGSAPSTSSAQGYSFPIVVAGAVTIKAIATAPGYLTSASTSAEYTVTSFTPVITTVAGAGVAGFAGADGPAMDAQFGTSEGVAVDKAGNIYLCDDQNNVVWLISAASGTASLFAGTGTRGRSGDGGPAASAQLNFPQGIALDSAGNLYIADSNNNVIRKVDAGTGMISTVAGGGSPTGNIGDGGPATSASLLLPSWVALDVADNLYIADTYNYAVREVSAQTGMITTVAGNGTNNFSGDGGAATKAGIQTPDLLAVDRSGNIYLGNSNSARVRKVAAATGVITTVAGVGDIHGNIGDGGPATSAQIYAQSISVDAAGNLYLADWPAQIRKVDANTGVITKVAGIGFMGFDGDGSSALAAELRGPTGMAFDTNGDLYFSDAYNYRVRKVTFAEQAVATPVFSVASGTYATAQTVAITDATPGAAIYYTTDGSTPGTSSTAYSGPLTVSSSETINAIAMAIDYNASAVASATYLIGVQAPSPSLTSLSPAFTSAGGAAFTLTANGAGFTVASTINWGTTALTTQYVSATQLTAQVPAADVATAGVISVTVQTPAPGGGTSNALSFEIDTAGSGTPPSFPTGSISVTAGATATYPVTLPSTATNVTVRCLNLPTGAACSYSASAGAVTITTAATTPTGNYQITVVFTETLPGANAVLALLPLLLLPWASRGRRRRARLWIVGSVGLVIVILAAGGGCGGGGTPTPPPPTHQVTSSGTVTLIVK